MADAKRIGRVEAGLSKDLATRHEIGQAERAALRAQARAIDTAEGRGETEAVTRANAVYLDMRRAAGLNAGASRDDADPFDRLLADVLRPTPGTSDTAHT